MVALLLAGLLAGEVLPGVVLDALAADVRLPPSAFAALVPDAAPVRAPDLCAYDVPAAAFLPDAAPVPASAAVYDGERLVFGSPISGLGSMA